MEARKNASIGGGFEKIFESAAMHQGFLVCKNHLSAKFKYNGELELIPGELDFKIISKRGGIAFLDMKSFGDREFPFSSLKAHQVQRAGLYNEWNVVAGFIVWFRPIDTVVFYSGHDVQRSGPGTSFAPEDGMILGGLANFDLNLVLRS
jgi:hypothetical protein